jgi:hypothetical protein
MVRRRRTQRGGLPPAARNAGARSQSSGPSSGAALHRPRRQSADRRRRSTREASRGSGSRTARSRNRLGARARSSATRRLDGRGDDQGGVTGFACAPPRDRAGAHSDIAAPRAGQGLDAQPAVRGRAPGQRDGPRIPHDRRLRVDRPSRARAAPAHRGPSPLRRRTSRTTGRRSPHLLVTRTLRHCGVR